VEDEGRRDVLLVRLVAPEDAPVDRLARRDQLLDLLPRLAARAPPLLLDELVPAGRAIVVKEGSVENCT
jgi:hypothetical protein